MKTNILITTIGRRGTLTKIFKKELNKMGSKLVVTDNSPLAPALYQADNYYLTPRVDDPRYIDTLLKICQKEDIKVVIPLLEKSFPLLAKSSDRFSQAGITLLLSSEEVIAVCKDKYRLYKYFIKNEFPTPQTFLIDKLEDKIEYPLFIKPRYGQGSQDTFKINNKRELDFFSEYIDYPLLQEYVQGVEYTVDTFSDLKGRVLTVIPRKRIEVRAGEVSKAVTVNDRSLINRVKEIIEGLKIVGPANLQAIMTEEGEIKFIEINPRFGGGVPLSYQAGVNYPELIVKLVEGEEIKPSIGIFKEGLVMLRYDTPFFIEKNEL